MTGPARWLQDTGEVEFVNARLEDAQLPRARYRAVFSASAIHWIDPDVGWRRIADTLVAGGTLALVSYFGVREPFSDADQQALHAALAWVASEHAAEWPVYRDVPDTVAGAAERRENVSDAWAWLGGYEISRPEPARLFAAAELATAAMRFEHTAEQLNALLATMSFWSELAPAQREALQAETDALHQRLGRPVRSSALACLLTARRQDG